MAWRCHCGGHHPVDPTNWLSRLTRHQLLESSHKNLYTRRSPNFRDAVVRVSPLHLHCISTATPQCYLFPFFNSLVLEIKILFGNPFQKFWKKPVDPFGESTGTLVLVGLFGFRRSLNRRVYAPSNSPPYIPLVSRVTRTNRRRHNANSIWVLVFWFWCNVYCIKFSYFQTTSGSEFWYNF